MKNRRILRELDKGTFLRQLRQLFPISLIYYPGCGDDGIPEGVFKPEEIVYLDDGTDIPVKYREHPYKFILGDYGKSPFRDHVFDALFYQDNHADVNETMEMLGTIRPGGIVIHSNDDCSVLISDDCSDPRCIDVERFGQIPNLEKITLPFRNRYYTVFRTLPTR